MKSLKPWRLQWLVSGTGGPTPSVQVCWNVPAHGKGRIAVHLAYFYPQEFTAKDKGDVGKVTPSVGRRLKEINGLVLFDKYQSYRFDLPADWKNWKDKLEEPPPSPKVRTQNP